MAQVRTVDGQHVEGTGPVVEFRHDECPTDPFSWQSVEGHHVDRLDLESREEPESPVAMLQTGEGASTGHLEPGEGAMFVEVQAALASEVGEPRLPGPAATARSDPLSRGEGGEGPTHPQTMLQELEQVLAVIATP